MPLAVVKGETSGMSSSNQIMKNLQLHFICSVLTITLFGATISRAKEYRRSYVGSSGSEYVPNKNKMMSYGGEPSCEELKEMWRFSRRQSRAAEITNEIPTYRDPFAYNVWEQYPKTRSVIGAPVKPYSKPVYGRVVHYAPPNHHKVLAEQERIYREMLKQAGVEKPEEEIRRILPTYRLTPSYPNGNIPIEGSFQRLKELIYAERAKELQEQRMQEETRGRKTFDKFAQPLKEGSRGLNPNDYGYSLNQDSKAAKLRMLHGDTDLEPAFAPDIYRRPHRQRSAFNSDAYNERFW